MINRNKKDLLRLLARAQRNPTGLAAVGFRASTQPEDDKNFIMGIESDMILGIWVILLVALRDQHLPHAVIFCLQAANF